MTFIDTNILLRWLLNDHPELSDKARQLIETTEDGELLVSDVVLAEIYYVLRGQHYSNSKIASLIEDFMQQAAFNFDNETRLTSQLAIIAETNLDFADCYLIARAILTRQNLKTFDHAMQKAYAKHRSVK
jgi:predicted nucleic acid-binding protein